MGNLGLCGVSCAVSGEAPLGEYASQGSAGACGDDAGEYLVSSQCTGATASSLCCDSSGDQISADDVCIASCPTGAITQPQQSDEQIISTLRSMLRTG